MGAIFVILLVCSVAGLLVGNSKGKAGAGFLLGLFLGPLGVIVAALLTPTPAVQAEREAAVERARQRLDQGGSEEWARREMEQRRQQGGEDNQ